MEVIAANKEMTVAETEISSVETKIMADWPETTAVRMEITSFYTEMTIERIASSIICWLYTKCSLHMLPFSDKLLLFCLSHYFQLKKFTP